jgi:hypothetical protein
MSGKKRLSLIFAAQQKLITRLVLRGKPGKKWLTYAPMGRIITIRPGTFAKAILSEVVTMNQTAFQLTQADHAKAMHLLDAIKQQSASLGPDNAASGTVINALAESVLWLLIAAHPADVASKS